MIRVLGLSFIALFAFSAVNAQAEDYPSRPIRILVPYAPGGIADIAARLVGAKLTDAWGQQVIVENRPGGNGFIAVTDAARSAPDGYTLVMVTTGDVSINPVLFKDVPYDVGRDLAPISAVSDAPMVLATNGASQVPIGRRRDRGRQGAAGRAGRLYARLRQHQPAGAGVDCAQYRHQIRPRAVQRRRAGRAGIGCRRRSVRRLGKLLGRPACIERPYPRIGHYHRQTVAAQSGLADAERNRAPATSMRRTGPRFWRPKRRRSRSSTSSTPNWSKSSICPT